MKWFLWGFVALIAINAIACVAAVGKPRKPMTSGAAATIVLLDAALVVGLVWVAGAVS